MTGSFERSDYLDGTLVAAGRIRRPTGIKGTVLVEVYSNDKNRFSVGDVISINGAEHRITETGVSGKAIKLTFENIDSIEKANLLRGMELSVTAESLPEKPTRCLLPLRNPGNGCQHLGRKTSWIYNRNYRNR